MGNYIRVKKEEAKPMLEPLTKPGMGVELISIEFDNIFPVFFKYYNTPLLISINYCL